MRPRRLFPTAHRGRHRRELQLHPQHLSTPRYVCLFTPTQLGREGARGLCGAGARSCFPWSDLSYHDDRVLHGMRCGVCVPPVGQHSVVWGEPPALLHCFICPMGVLWSGEMSVNWRSCVPPLGAEVVLREGLKRSLCEEAVQMYFLSCINQLEGSKGS